MTVQGGTFNMPRHANATALFSNPVVSALGSKLDYPGSSPGQAPLLGLAKSIYYID